MLVLPILALAFGAYAQIRPSSCAVGGAAKRAEATDVSTTSLIEKTTPTADIAFPYPTTIFGHVTNVTGHEVDGTKVIDWDDEWWPMMTPEELAEMGYDPEELALQLEDDFDSPLNGTEVHLEKRANGRKCSTRQYTRGAANAAFNALMRHLQQGTHIMGANRGESIPSCSRFCNRRELTMTATYPHYFGGNTSPVIRWALPACNNNNNPCIPKNVYPILRNGRAFATNANPGPDRVVITYYPSGNILRYGRCGLMTHSSAGGNNFVKCT